MKKFIKLLIAKILQTNFLKRILCAANYYKVTNKNVMASISECDAYYSLEKEFADILGDAENTELPYEESDYIWILWLQGEENAPPIVKACINSIRKYWANKKIVVLSNENISQYISLPYFIEEKYKQRVFGAAHYSDLLRTELLYRYGGIWIDSTVLCTSNSVPQSIFRAPLFVYQKIDLTRLDINPTICSSWFIAAKKNCKIISLTRKLLFEYWNKHSTLCNYFLFHICFTLASRKYDEEWSKVPVFNNQSPHTFQFELQNEYQEERWNEIIKMSSFHKLNHHNDYSKYGDNTMYSYIISNFLE